MPTVTVPWRSGSRPEPARSLSMLQKINNSLLKTITLYWNYEISYQIKCNPETNMQNSHSTRHIFCTLVIHLCFPKFADECCGPCPAPNLVGLPFKLQYPYPYAEHCCPSRSPSSAAVASQQQQQSGLGKAWGGWWSDHGGMFAACCAEAWLEVRELTAGSTGVNEFENLLPQFGLPAVSQCLRA